MHVRVVTAPQPIVTWEEAKAHLRLSSEAEKALVESYIAAATAWIDGPAGWLGHSLGPQLLQWDGRLTCDRTPLPYGPILEVESIVTDANSQDPVTVDPINYHLHINGNLIVPTGAAWVLAPDLRIRYWTGYAARDPQDATAWIVNVPAPIKQAILLLIGQWFTTRAAVNVGNIVNAMPFAVEALLAPYRTWR